MRILHVTSAIDARLGGVTSVISGMASGQRKAGVEVEVLSTYAVDDDFSLARTLSDEGVDIRMIGPTHGPFSRHKQLEEQVDIAVRAADLVHIHALWEEVQHLAAVLSRVYKKPYIICPHGMLDPWCLNQSKWVKKVYLAWRLRRNLQGATALHFTSQIEADLVKPLGLRPPSIVEPNGVHLEEFQSLPERGAFRAAYPEIGDGPYIIFLGRLHPKKGLDLLIDAFSRMNNRHARLVIVGPSTDDYQARLQDLADSKAVGGRVHFIGMLRGAQRISAMVDAELFCLPSHQENFGIAVVESLGAGTPVVISDQVNIFREIANARVGGVVPLDVVALSQELDRWLDDPTLREYAIQHCRAFVAEHYDWNSLSARWVQHYNRLIPSASLNTVASYAI